MPVALKELKPRDGLEESTSFAAIGRHPNVIVLLDVIRWVSACWLVFPLMGESLADLIYRRGKVEEVEARHIMKHIVTGLAHVHARGVVHCDVKPGNVLIDGALVLAEDLAVLANKGIGPLCQRASKA